jgi:hypothetical protein
MNKAYIISCALAGTLSLLLGIFVYLKNKTSNVNKVGMFLNFGVGLWTWSLFGRELSFEKTTALFFIRLSYVGVIFIPAIFLHFVSSIIKEVKYKLILPVYALFLIFLIFNSTPLFIKDAGPILSFRYYGIPGGIYLLFVILFAATIVYSHYILIKYFKKSEGQIRNQIRYLLFATAIGFVGGVTGFFPNFNIEIFPFGFYLISLYVVITSYAIAKHRLMDINIVFKKGTTYVLLMLLLFVPSFLLIILSQKLFFNNINYLFSGIIFLLLLLVTILFYRIKPHTEKAVEQLLFKNHYDYRETLGKFSKAMVTILDLQSLSKRIIETITQTMGVEKASLFLWEEEKGGYSLFESKNIKMTAQFLSFLKMTPYPTIWKKSERLLYGKNWPRGLIFQN